MRGTDGSAAPRPLPARVPVPREIDAAAVLREEAATYAWLWAVIRNMWVPGCWVAKEPGRAPFVGGAALLVINVPRLGGGVLPGGCCAARARDQASSRKGPQTKAPQTPPNPRTSWGWWVCSKDEGGSLDGYLMPAGFEGVGGDTTSPGAYKSDGRPYMVRGLEASPCIMRPRAFTQFA